MTPAIPPAIRDALAESLMRSDIGQMFIRGAFFSEMADALLASEPLASLLAVAECAHALAGATTHVNVSGPAYAERRDYYALLRAALAALPREDDPA